MPRSVRIQFPGAIYHIMSRGNQRQRIFQEAADYNRFIKGLETTVIQSDWEMFSFVLMPNHVHLFFRTRQANLSLGMQRLLSGYANWFAKRHRRPGHLLQGRFHDLLVEDESYFWSVSRYIHLNPTRGKRPLVSHPAEWAWSSFPGYYRQQHRLPWVAYESVYNAWKGESGGSDPASAYCRFVEAGLAQPPANPFKVAAHDWLLGSKEFAKDTLQRVENSNSSHELPRTWHLGRPDVDLILSTVAQYYSVPESELGKRGNSHVARAVAAWLSRRLTTRVLRELAPMFGLTRPESVSNLTRRVDDLLTQDHRLQQDIANLEEQIRRQYTTA